MGRASALLVGTLAIALADVRSVVAQAPHPERSHACSTQILTGEIPAFELLLMSDAVAHVRATAANVARRVESTYFCYAVNDVSADVVTWVPLSSVPIEPTATVVVSSERIIRDGDELLVFVQRDRKDPNRRLVAHIMTMVTGSQVKWDDDDQLGLRDEMPVGAALRQLQATYALHTRYRSYGVDAEAGLETLEHRTGWIMLGTWKDGTVSDDSGERPFEFDPIADVNEPLPRVNDRIRFRSAHSVTILDYGSRGEALRLVSPGTRRTNLFMSDSTGARVEAGRVVVVADVQIEERDGSIADPFVWVRVLIEPH